MAHKYDVLSEALKEKMENLVHELNPERLTCDGEVRGADLDHRVNEISSRWWGLVDEALSIHKINVDFNEFSEYANIQY